jgi:hypothetical protein
VLRRGGRRAAYGGRAGYVGRAGGGEGGREGGSSKLTPIYCPACSQSPPPVHSIRHAISMDQFIIPKGCFNIMTK